MDLLGLTYQVSNAHSFFQELEEILAPPLDTVLTLDALDFALRTCLVFAAQYYDDYLQETSALDHFLHLLMSSQIFLDHTNRVLDRITDILLVEQDPSLLCLCLIVLDKRGKQHANVYRMLKQVKYPPVTSTSTQTLSKSSVMAVLIGIIEKYGADALGTQPEKHSKLAAHERLGLSATRMLYEVCRASKLSRQDLSMFSKAFVEHLFRLVESTRDGDELLNYTLIKLIIALNEQFMVCSLDNNNSTDPSSPSKSSSKHGKKDSNSSSEGNIVLSTIKEYLGAHKTFGENLIFILNRCDGSTEDLCVSLLILKILYLLFTTPGTSEYFYTNDLCVLVDVFLRELNDLPEENEGLRHTYLRVLHPLLTNTQLKTVPYKRPQIRRILHSLVSDSHRRSVHSTTKRLVERNLKAQWALDLDAIDPLPLIQAPSSPAPPNRPVNRDLYQLASSDEITRRNSTLSVDSVAEAKSNTISSPRRPVKHALSSGSIDDSVLPNSQPMLPSLSVPTSVAPRPSSAASSYPAVPVSGRRKPPAPPVRDKDKKKANGVDACKDEPPPRKRAVSEHSSSKPKLDMTNRKHDPFLSPDKLKIVNLQM